MVHLNSLFGPDQNEISYSNGRFRLAEVAALQYDVNFDGAVNAGDIHLMQDAVAGGSLHEFFDVDGDGGPADSDDLQTLFAFLGTGWGDINLDGRVDTDDASILLTHFGKCSYSWEKADFNGDYSVDTDDASILLENWTNVYVANGAEELQAASVPEPATLGLLVLGGLALIRRTRRNS